MKHNWEGNSRYLFADVCQDCYALHTRRGRAARAAVHMRHPVLTAARVRDQDTDLNDDHGQAALLDI